LVPTSCGRGFRRTSLSTFWPSRLSIAHRPDQVRPRGPSIDAARPGRIEGPHRTAALLEINPHTLRARMRKLGIDWNKFRAEG
jgi:hypothetical protein